MYNVAVGRADDGWRNQSDWAFLPRGYEHDADSRKKKKSETIFLVQVTITGMNKNWF